MGTLFKSRGDEKEVREIERALTAVVEVDGEAEVAGGATAGRRGRGPRGRRRRRVHLSA